MLLLQLHGILLFLFELFMNSESKVGYCRNSAFSADFDSTLQGQTRSIWLLWIKQLFGHVSKHGHCQKVVHREGSWALQPSWTFDCPASAFLFSAGLQHTQYEGWVWLIGIVTEEWNCNDKSHYLDFGRNKRHPNNKPGHCKRRLYCLKLLCMQWPEEGRKNLHLDITSVGSAK